MTVVDAARITGACQPEAVRAYGGGLQGDDRAGVMDIEFRSLHAAVSWAHTWEISGAVRFRDPLADLAGPCVVQVKIRPCRTCHDTGRAPCECCDRSRVCPDCDAVRGVPGVPA